MTDHSIIGNIRKLIIIENTWIVLDDVQNQILKFSMDGQYLGKIGNVGEGPGEYVQAANIVKVLGNNIAVEDGLRGFVLVYDLEGNLVRETPRPGSNTDGGKFIVSHNFIWNELDRFYLSNFSVMSTKIPQHVALDYTTKSGKTLFGFGERFSKYEQWAIDKKASRFVYTEFLEINNRIWAADPKFAHIDIYDKDGNHVKRILGPHPDSLTPQDYDNFKPNRKNFRRLWSKKLKTITLIPLQNLVIQRVSSARKHLFNVFDANGNLLKTNLTPDVFSCDILTASNEYLVNRVAIIDASTYPDIFNEQEMSMLMDAGWNPATIQDDNAYLCLRSLNL